MKAFGSSKEPLAASNKDLYLKEMQGLERDILDEMAASKRFAKQVAFGCIGIVIAALLVFAVFIKETATPVPPVVLKVDKQTGATEVITVLADQKASYGEVVDDHNVHMYVLSHETYNWHTIDADHHLVQLESTPDVFADYNVNYTGDKSLDKVIGDSAEDKVKIISIMPAINPDAPVATVRYTKTHITRDGPGIPQHFIATVAYRYVGSPLKVTDRWLDPLGFQVTSWHSDPEIVQTTRVGSGQ